MSFAEFIVSRGSGTFAELKDIYPSDDEFQQAFRVKQERSNQKVQYFLRCIEQQAIQQQSGKSELGPGDLTVEHVLPRHPGKEWDPIVKTDQSIVEDCAARIGNTVLLAEVGNIKAAGKSFSDKKKVLEKSDLLTTKAAAKHSTWDRQNIDHHQAYLAKLAVSTWRFDVSLSEVMQAALKPKQQEKKL